MYGQSSSPFCTTAICSPSCQNGGVCTAPDTCSCTAGWTGSLCDEGETAYTLQCHSDSSEILCLIPYSMENFVRFKFSIFCDVGEITKVYLRNFSFVKISVVHCTIVIGFACDHGPVEVFLIQSRSLPDPKCPLSSTVRPQAIDSAN